MSCHLTESLANQNQIFKGLPSACIHCHHNVHETQFDVEGTTNCQKCHGFSNWEAILFNHDQTAFKLERKTFKSGL